MINRPFTYAGLTFSPFVIRSGYKATFAIIPQQQIEQLVLRLAGEDGMEAYRAFLGNTVLQIQGEVRGQTERDLNNKIEELHQSLLPKELESNEATDGFVPVEFNEGEGKSSRYFAKPFRNMPVISHKIPVGGGAELVRSFTILLFCKDPIKYSSSELSVEMIIEEDPSGSSALPQEIPFPIASSESEVTDTINNPSSVQSVLPNDIIITGPIVGPAFENTTTGKRYAFTSDVSLASGESLEIDFSQGTAYKVDGSGFQTSVIQYLTSDSTPWSILPGSNTIRLFGAGVVAGETKVNFTVLLPA